MLKGFSDKNIYLGGTSPSRTQTFVFGKMQKLSVIMSVGEPPRSRVYRGGVNYGRITGIRVSGYLPTSPPTRLARYPH